MEGDTAPSDDQRFAHWLAKQAGDLLLDLRSRARKDRWSPWKLEEAGDFEANRFICDQLAHYRADDAVLSEELYDNGERLDASRVWIIDPLDGSYDFGDHRATSYAVHIALVANGRPVAAAVSVPELGRVFCTDDPQPSPKEDLRPPIIISGRSTAVLTARLANTMGGQAIIAGSAGVKAMAVVEGRADIYFHPSGLYEWDACAPAAVSENAGLSVTDLRGRPLEYNKAAPEIHGLVIARPGWGERVLDIIN